MLERAAQARDLGIRQRTRASPGIETGLVQHLIRDPVAHPGREALIEQQRLERRRARPHEIAKARKRGQGTVRVESEPADRWLARGIPAQPDAPEPPCIRHHELAAVVEDEMELREARRPRAVRFFPARLELHGGAAGGRVEVAGHAEVQARPRPAVELEPEVLAVTRDPPYPTTDEGSPDARGWHTLEYDGIVGAARLDDSTIPGHLHRDAAAALDLGKLGHRAEHTSAEAGEPSYIPDSHESVCASDRSGPGSRVASREPGGVRYSSGPPLGETCCGQHAP